jgi:hypothetical protein
MAKNIRMAKNIGVHSSVSISETVGDGLLRVVVCACMRFHFFCSKQDRSNARITNLGAASFLTKR